MSFVPVHEAHAIDRVSATVLFSAPVASDDWLPILVKAHGVAKDIGFPKFQESFTASFSATADAGTPAVATTQVFSVGGGFQLEDAGKQLAEFVVYRNAVRIDLRTYVRWNGYRELLSSILHPLVSAYPQSTSIAQLKLEYWDRFVSPDQRSQWSELFRSDGRLPGWTTQGTDNWHTYMGWFEGEEGGRRSLVNLHVDTINQPFEDGGLPVQTANLYTLTATIGTPVTIAEEPIEKLLTRFDDLHTISKKAIATVLAASMQERISLFAEPPL